MRTIFRAACAMMAAGVLAACGDLTGSGGLGADEGLVTFDYSGAVEGRFSARANLAQPPTGAYAAALFLPGLAGIQAANPRPNGRFDSLLLWGLFDFSVGTFPLCPGTGWGVPCMELRVFINWENGDEQLNPGDLVFWGPASGSVRIDKVTDSRVRGTFAGTVTDHLTGNILHVTNGKFDLPLREWPVESAERNRRADG